MKFRHVKVNLKDFVQKDKLLANREVRVIESVESSSLPPIVMSNGVHQHVMNSQEYFMDLLGSIPINDRLSIPTNDQTVSSSGEFLQAVSHFI